MDTKEQACIIAKCLVTFKWMDRKGWRAYAPCANKEVLEPLLSYGGRIDWVQGRWMWATWGNSVKELAKDAAPYLTKSQLASLDKRVSDSIEADPSSTTIVQRAPPSYNTEGQPEPVLPKVSVWEGRTCMLCGELLTPHLHGGIQRPGCIPCKSILPLKVW